MSGGWKAHKEALIRECAEAGLTRTEAAAELGVSYQTIVNRARAAGIKFRRAGDGHGVDHGRAEAMAAMYRSGKTLEEIGQLYGLTRERVRQVIKKCHGITGRDGGMVLRAKETARRKRAEKEVRYLQKHGCTVDQFRELVAFGEAMVTAGRGRYQTPLYAFQTQRRTARARGIEWRLLLWDWWQVWQRSGKWEQRGRGQGYMMCRFGDTGPYAVGNVYIATGVHNGTIQPNNPYRKSHPDFATARVDMAKRRGQPVDRRCEIDGCGSKHYALGLCRTHYMARRYSQKRMSMRCDQIGAAA